jgi:protein-S-isoprenylcysteine O-methyltransferase Ste14
MNGRLKQGKFFRTGPLLFLAIVFTVGLTFATLELPYYLDGVLQNTIPGLDADSHADEISRLKTELFMAHFHVRTVGYTAFFVLIGLIILGFSTKRTGLAALGALGVMLPAFAQFAGVMFFLAGLGILNAIWLPVLDISYELQNWGMVIRAPDDFIRWILGILGIHSAWPTIIFFTGTGILIFLLGVFAWLKARARGKGVADFWVYRLSRHPQYLGWILWTYGAFLLIQLMRYPKRSWGIGASLPWLMSTMVIIGVALLEELNMRRRHGEAYEAYRKSAPFLLPLPDVVTRIFTAPLRVIFRKELVDRRREVIVLVGTWTVLLMAVSAIFYAGGLEGALARRASPEVRAGQLRELMVEWRGEESGRRRYHLALQVASFGEMAVEPLVELLESDNATFRVRAAELLSSLPSEAAAPNLLAALSDSEEDVRFYALQALEASHLSVPPDAVESLIDDPEGNIRIRALAILARSRADVALERAPEFMADESYWIRGQAMRALGVPGFEEALPLVEAGLADEHEWVRREAVLALLRIGSPVARPALEAMAPDEDFEVRLYAVEALKRLSSE